MAHELTHAVRLVNNGQIDTSKLPFRASNATGPILSSTIFDADNVVKRCFLGVVASRKFSINSSLMHALKLKVYLRFYIY